jgi:hypothetical protein
MARGPRGPRKGTGGAPRAATRIAQMVAADIHTGVQSRLSFAGEQQEVRAQSARPNSLSKLCRSQAQGLQTSQASAYLIAATYTA